MISRLSLSVLGLLLISQASFAKTLSVNCTANSGDSVNLVTEIADINTPPALQSLVISGVKQNPMKDHSQMPVYNNGAFSLRIAFGQNLYNSVELKVKDCTDSFSATGAGVLKEYVGGFAGTQASQLKCTCELK